MAVLKDIVKNILVIVIMTSFLELLLPDGKIKPFVRFAIGLFILIAVLNPSISLLFNNNHDFQVNFWDYSEMDQSNEIMENGENIKEQLIKSNNDELKKKLEGQINVVAMLVPGVISVDTRAQVNDEGAVENLYLVIKTEERDENDEDSNMKITEKKKSRDEEQQQIETKIKSVVSNLYGFENIDIEIQIKGG